MKAPKVKSFILGILVAIVGSGGVSMEPGFAAGLGGSGCGTLSMNTPRCQMFMTSRGYGAAFSPFYGTPFLPYSMPPMLGQLTYYPSMATAGGFYSPYYFGGGTHPYVAPAPHGGMGWRAW
ncbi:MAG: hypothetical protein AB7P04_14535 [Bacteriovoracia bacterium]